MFSLGGKVVDGLLQFPVRPHWSKSSRSVLQQAKKNLNPAVSGIYTLAEITDHCVFQNLAAFSQVRKQFDPNNTFSSIVGEIMGL